MTDRMGQAVLDWIRTRRVRETMLREKVVSEFMLSRLPSLLPQLGETEQHAVMCGLLRSDRVLKVVAQHLQSRHGWPYLKAVATLEELRKHPTEDAVPPPDGMRVWVE